MKRRPGHQTGEIKRDRRDHGGPHRPAAQWQGKEANVEHIMHGISDLRLPALTVGVVYRTGYGYAPAQPADRKKKDGEDRRTMPLISAKLTTYNSQATHVTPPTKWKQEQKKAGPARPWRTTSSSRSMARQRSKCRTHNAWHKRPASASPDGRRRLPDRVWLCASPAGRSQEAGWAGPPHYALHKREACHLQQEGGSCTNPSRVERGSEGP